MNFIEKIISFYINSSINVALAVYALCRVTEAYLELPYNEPLDYSIFYGTIVAYNYIKYINIFFIKPLRFLKTHSLIVGVSIFASVLTVQNLIMLKRSTLMLLLLFGLLTFLYTVPSKKKWSLRQIPTLKIFIIALVWSGVTVLLPQVDANGGVLNYSALLLTLQRFLIVIVLTLPFDLRDMSADHVNLKSLPMVIGIEQVKKLGFVLLGVVMCFEFYMATNNDFKIAFIIIMLLLLIGVQRASTMQSKYYSGLFIEAIPILWWLLLIVN